MHGKEKDVKFDGNFQITNPYNKQLYLTSNFTLLIQQSN